MSKLKALIIMLAVTASSTAMASPGASFSARGQVSWGSYRQPVRPPVVRDHRAPIRTRYHSESRYQANDLRWQGSQEYRSSWMLVGTVNHDARLVLEPRVFAFGRYGAHFSRLLLQSNGGKSRILDVRVEYANGASEIFAIDRYVGERGTADLPASPTFQIDLTHRVPVTRIIINGGPAIASSFSIFAS